MTSDWKFVAPATALMAVVSSLGTLVNVYLMWKFSSSKREKSAFLKLCLVKTVPNTVICLAFLLWVVPLTAFSTPLASIPNTANELIGQVAGFGSYVAGPLIQLFMAVNRASVMFFPTRTFSNSSRNANIAIVFIVVVAAFFSGISFVSNSCGFIYDPEVLFWRPEETECAERMGVSLFYTVIVLSAASNTLNFLIFTKLCFDKVDGLSNDEMIRRRRKRIKLFVQSALQDCLHVIDMVNFNVISRWNRDTWFQFVFITMSLLMIHALDGFIMWIFHLGNAPTSKTSTVKTISVHPMEPK